MLLKVWLQLIQTSGRSHAFVSQSAASQTTLDMLLMEFSRSSAFKTMAEERK